MKWNTGDYKKYQLFIRETEKRFGIPIHLLAIILWQASKYDPAHIAGTKHNPIGVRGIANLTRDDCMTLWQGRDNRLDPLASIAGAARLLHAQYTRFGTWRLALLAYHSSAECVREHLHSHAELPFKAADYVYFAASQCQL